MRPIWIVLAAVLCVVSVTKAQLPAPQLNSPLNNAVNVATIQGVQWLYVAGASYMMVYQVQIATDSTFASHIVCDSTFWHMPHVIGVAPKLANSTTYFWRVRAADTAAGSQWGLWSAVWKFTTAASTPVARDRSAKHAAAADIAIDIANSKLCVRNAEAGNIVSVYGMDGRLLLRRPEPDARRPRAGPRHLPDRLRATLARSGRGQARARHSPALLRRPSAGHWLPAPHTRTGAAPAPGVHGVAMSPVTNRTR